LITRVYDPTLGGEGRLPAEMDLRKLEVRKTKQHRKEFASKREVWELDLPNNYAKSL
jgi:hypothetical protein